jgi:long-subunit acyl-CoA synthetase (AMP-forming)
MDWNEVPKGTGSAVNVSTWQDIIQDQEPDAGTELPALDKSSRPKPVLSFWPSGELVSYTHANLIAGIAGQLTSVPTTQRMVHADLFLPVDSLSGIYPLVLTLSALYSNASVALNSVAGRGPDLVLATHGVAPTIIVATPQTLAQIHSDSSAKLNSPFYQIVHWFQTRSLVQNGVMPLASSFSRMYDSARPVLGTTSGKLRLIYVAEQAGVGSTPLSSRVLSDLRIYTGARIIYALTSAKVAGAVTQTGPYDYRVDHGEYSHFGAPVTSVEIFLKDTAQHKTTDQVSAGEIYALGPAVVGGETSLGINGKIKDDYTLALL